MASREEKAPTDPAAPALPSGDGTAANKPDPSSIPEPTAAQPTVAEVLETLEEEKEVRWATWEDLCESGGRQKRYKLRNGAEVLYTTFVSLEKVGESRLKAMVGGRFIQARFIALVLKEVLIRPRIETDEQFRNAMKADGMALLDIYNEVQNLNRALRNAQEEELGES